MKATLILLACAASSAAIAAPTYKEVQQLLLKWEEAHTKGTIIYIAGGTLDAADAKSDPSNPERNPRWFQYEFDGKKERLVHRPWTKGEDASRLYSQYRISGTNGRRHFEGETKDHVISVDSKSLLELYERDDPPSSIGPQNLFFRSDETRRHSEWMAEASRSQGFSIAEAGERIRIHGLDRGGTSSLEIDATTGRPLRRLFVSLDPDSETVEYSLKEEADGSKTVDFSAYKTAEPGEILNKARMRIESEEYGKADQAAFDFEKAPPGSIFWDVAGKSRYVVKPDGTKELMGSPGGPSVRPSQNSLPNPWVILGAFGLAALSGIAALMSSRKRKGQQP